MDPQNKEDLSLISTKDLFKEIYNRFPEPFLYIYIDPHQDDHQGNGMTTIHYFKKGCPSDIYGLLHYLELRMKRTVDYDLQFMAEDI